MARTLKHRELNNTRISSSYGSWIYCDGCHQTIGYLCYVTYDYFQLSYTCKCGNCGSAYLDFDDTATAKASNQLLITVKNRLCCPKDNSPLITILTKNLADYQYDIVCKACHSRYQGQQGR